ncbi:MAG: cytochrome P450 [Haloglomus sp.]
MPQDTPPSGAGRAPPRPAGLPVLKHTVDIARDRLGFVREARRTCGDVFVAESLGLGEICYLTHPEAFELALKTDRDAFAKGDIIGFVFGDGLLAVDGAEWETQRELLSEFFYPERIRSYAETMVAVIERRLDRWVDGDRRSLLDQMTALTLEIMSETLLGRSLPPGADPELRAAVSDLNSYFTPASIALPRWLPLPSRRRFARADQYLRDELRGLLDERADPNRRGDDLLSALAALAADPEAPVDTENALDQLVTFLFAGHESTALALTFTLYELGRHPDVRDRVHAEVDATLDGDGTLPTLADTRELSTVERALREALRCYPPAHTLPRRTTRDVLVRGCRIPAGTQTHLALHSVHRDDRFYDDPDAFRPERWRDTTPEEKEYAYVPFGAGPRTCIGRRFALLEAKLVLATLCSRFELEPREPLELAPRMSTQPAGDVPVTIHARD